MKIDQTQQAGITILRVDGRLDASTVPDFDAQWKKLLEEGAGRLVVDFRDLEYISSAGLRGVLMLAKTAKMRKAEIVYAGARGMVADMFRISGFLSILRTADDADAAVRMLG